jgi:hypothetical protein
MMLMLQQVLGTQVVRRAGCSLVGAHQTGIK